MPFRDSHHFLIELKDLNNDVGNESLNLLPLFFSVNSRNFLGKKVRFFALFNFALP